MISTLLEFRLVSGAKPESIVLRQFCRVYFNPLPNKSTLLRWANLITVETLKQFNQLLTAYATQLQITQGKRMRTDGTVVETNIHFPSDNSLLVDGVRVRQQHEKQRYFRQRRYWHNGVEGHISYLKRSFGFNRCLYWGDLGFERWVALGIIAHNLTIISWNLVQRISSSFNPN